MKKTIFIAALVLGCGIGWSADWLADGGDTVRSGWVKDEKIFNKDNVKGMKLLWKVDTKNQFHALHSLMAPLIVQNVPTSTGPKELVFVLRNPRTICTPTIPRKSASWSGASTSAMRAREWAVGAVPRPAQ